MNKEHFGLSERRWAYWASGVESSEGAPRSEGNMTAPLPLTCSVKNTAARILTRTGKSYTGFQLHLGLILKFKLLLVYKSLNGLGPKYMADMLTEYKPNRPLRSVGSSQLEIPRVQTKQGESAFSYFTTRSWN